MAILPISSINYSYSSKSKMQSNKVTPKQINFGNGIKPAQTDLMGCLTDILSKTLRAEVVKLAEKAKPAEISQELAAKLEKLGVDVKRTVQIDLEHKPHFVELEKNGNPKTIAAFLSDSACKYEYLPGEEIAVSLYRSNGTCSYYYHYDALGKLKTKHWESQGITIISDLEYDAAGNILKETWKGDNGVIQKIIEYNKGKTFRITQYSADGETPLSIKTYNPETGELIGSQSSVDRRTGVSRT